ncbi:GNAT family N-acetyltransferase [Nocardioides acrostichi]|uniref:GNAT family N-acetyltransferase n=1 Tax=Nocardioides acrostichi TaxID=2784339 RepID=A0A930V1Q6_9ACTN|nr:GNAT family N-acetyltransferase [Nocardioides acrostichi]MBF4162434.1 GNAT family N-acetyltransferase [Nocardioides acrostichi]
MLPVLRIERVDHTHPDALRLIEEVQQVYVARYGGRDETLIDPLDFAPPVGSFFVGYLTLDPDGSPDAGPVAVASGAWRRTATPLPGASAVAEVKRMYVVPAAQRRGLGRAMLAHLERTARLAGYDGLVLETGTLQPEAIALYASAGYTRVRPFGHYRDDPLSVCFGRHLLETAPG